MNTRARRIWHTTQLLLQQAGHLRVAWLVGGAVAAFIVLALALRHFHFGSEEARFYLSAARMALFAGGATLCALTGPALFFDAERSRVVQLLLVRGVRRGEWVGALWLVHLVLIGALVLISVGALAAVLASRDLAAAIPDAVRQLALGGGPLVILSGAAVLASALTRSAPAAAGVTFAIAIAGQLAPILRHVQARTDGIAQWAWRALDWLVPDFSLALSGNATAAALYAVAFSAVYVALGAVLFSRREL